MRTLVIGGSGLVGWHSAQAIQGSGHSVVLGARRLRPDLGFELLQGDYAEGGFSERDLAGFHAVVFAAGQDVRHRKPGDDAGFWVKYQSEGISALAERCRRAGVERFVLVGSCYHQAMPELIASDAYVRARAMAEERTLALASESFSVVTINPSWIVGLAPGRSHRGFRRMIAWARGMLPQVPFEAPPGGSNFMSVESVSQAIAGALRSGDSGKAYLVGDLNLSFKEYLELFAAASGRELDLVVTDREHPFIPDSTIVPGRGSTLSYVPDESERVRLNYKTGDVSRAVEDLVRTLDAESGA